MKKLLTFHIFLYLDILHFQNLLRILLTSFHNKGMHYHTNICVLALHSRNTKKLFSLAERMRFELMSQMNDYLLSRQAA